jgi:hypothetical protein
VKRAVFTIALIATFAIAGLAQAGISVFKTSFNSRGDYKSVKALAGKSGCGREWRNKSALGVTTEGGKLDCALATPVSADSDKPDQIIQVVGKVTKATDDKVKEAIYVGVAVRANKKQGYELRIFPKAREWELRRNGERVDGDRDKAIEGLAKKNRIQLQAIGSTVTAKVNGQRLIEFKDKSSDGVGGRKNALIYGDRKDTESADGEAFFDKLKVQIPSL